MTPDTAAGHDVPAKSPDAARDVAAPDRFDHLRALAEALSATLDPRAVARIVVEHALAALNAPAGLVGVVDGDDLLLLHHRGYEDALIAPWRRMPLSSDAPLTDAIRAGRPVFLEDADAWEARYPGILERAASAATGPEKAGSLRWAALPLMARGRAVGALGVTLPDGGSFAAEDRAFVEALARQCAQALEHARLFAEADAARREAETQRDRLAFLAEAGSLLAASLDYQATLNAVARLAVPRLADWCAVDMAPPDGGSPERLAVAHVDPAKIEWAAQLAREYPPKMDDPTGMPRVLRTGESEYYPDVPDDLLVAAAKGDEKLLGYMRAVGFRSVVIVPMTARGRTLGAITFVTTSESGRTFSAQDVTLLENLGERAGLAVDNARLHRDAVSGEERFRELADTAPVLIWMADPEGGNTYVNRPWLEFTGTTDAPEAHRGAGWTRWLHPDDIAPLTDAFTRAFAERRPAEAEMRLRRADGQWRWLMNRGRPRWDTAGRFVGFVGSCVDVTERKEAEAALAEQEARQRALLGDVMASVTEGRLRLVESPDDLPTRLPAAAPPVALTLRSLSDLRRLTRVAAEGEGQADERWQDLQTAAGEASMNAVVHAGGGTASVGAEDGTVQVWIEDTGGGIAMDSLPRATLLRGYSSAGTLGHGFWMILKTCDRVWLCTGPTGTTVVLEQDRVPPMPTWFRDK